MHLINGMMGLGDNIYSRAFVKNLRGDVYLRTPWPQLFADLPNVKPVNPDTGLRTQAKNASRDFAWHEMPQGKPLRIKYGNLPIFNGLEIRFGVPPGTLDLPDFGPSPVSAPYVVIRPATVRSEWRADSRNPEPAYIAEAARMATDRGYRVVSVADLCNEEWLVGDLPPADIYFHGGELRLEKLLALVKGASAVIGGVGWIVPACIAAKVPAWIICGGNGGYNAPERITDKRMDTSRIGWAIPDKYCRCTEAIHNCDKRITNHAEKFAAWADRYLAVV
jgi:hypothetical protein